MKFAGALRHDVPVLEDVLAGLAILVGPAGDGAPTLRLDAVGRHRVGSGSAQQAVLEDLVVEPLVRLGRRILDVERYATELHDPEITEPSSAASSPAASSTPSSAGMACPASRRRRGTSRRPCRGSRTRSAPSARASSRR